MTEAQRFDKLVSLTNHRIRYKDLIHEQKEAQAGS